MKTQYQKGKKAYRPFPFPFLFDDEFFGVPPPDLGIDGVTFLFVLFSSEFNNKYKR